MSLEWVSLGSVHWPPGLVRELADIGHCALLSVLAWSTCLSPLPPTATPVFTFAAAQLATSLNTCGGVQHVLCGLTATTRTLNRPEKQCNGRCRTEQPSKPGACIPGRTVAVQLHTDLGREGLIGGGEEGVHGTGERTVHAKPCKSHGAVTSRQREDSNSQQASRAHALRGKEERRCIVCWAL